MQKRFHGRETSTAKTQALNMSILTMIIWMKAKVSWLNFMIDKLDISSLYATQDVWKLFVVLFR